MRNESVAKIDPLFNLTFDVISITLSSVALVGSNEPSRTGIWNSLSIKQVE